MYRTDDDRFMTDPETRSLFAAGKKPPEEYRSPADVGEGISWNDPRGTLREGTVIAYRRWDEGGKKIGALLMECRDAEDPSRVWACPVSSPYWWHASRPLPEADLEGVAAMRASRGEKVDTTALRREFCLTDTERR